MMTRMRKLRILGGVGVLAAALALASCVEHETAAPVVVPQHGGDLFLRYVAMGNSITAGIQSGGINDSTQRRTYPYFLAQQAGARFEVPFFFGRGCPPPFQTSFLVSQARVGPGSTATTCDLRAPSIPRFVQNVAVPGSTVSDALEPARTGASGTFQVMSQFILGGRSQLAAMEAAQPTFVSVWLGNNDWLGTFTSGNTALLTPLATFSAAIDAIAAGINRTPARDAVLISVVNPLFLPYVQPGAFFFMLQAAGQLPPGKVVDVSCAPGSPLAANLVSFNALQDPGLAVISCANDAPYLLNPTEQQAITSRVGEYNQKLQQVAQANDWLYVDLNASFLALVANPNEIRKCQGLATAQTQQELMAAVQNTCPSAMAPFFGNAVSYDAIHPSTAMHVRITNELIARINQRHGLSIPLL
jgi:hypothetical protein